MNILITPDVHEWAIGKIARAIVRNNPRFNFFNVAVHPRGVLQGLTEIKKLLKDGVRFDLWHPQYWNSAYQLLEICPELKPVPKVLTHHNHYHLDEKDWAEFDSLAIATEWGRKKLSAKHKSVFKIPMGIDLDEYSFLKNYPPEQPAVGYVGRVVPHKNLLEICRTAKKLNYQVVGTGYIDKPEYWQIVEPYVKDGTLEFNGGYGRTHMMPENFEVEFYRRLTCFVMYSGDEKETGTVPLLEAMARGVPVLATDQGMARDLIRDGENGLLFNADNFEEKLKLMMENSELREKLRRNAWKTIKNYSEQSMARDFARVYYRTLYGEQKIVSVIVPTFNRVDKLIEVIASIDKSEYPAKEIIICDDGSDDGTEEAVKKLKAGLRTPILYLKTGTKLEYGLAKARNCGAIEALGDILLFLDDRFILRPDTLDMVVKNNWAKSWNFGCKVVAGEASKKRAFVENFSWISKKEFIETGMFCERIEQYGGLSEETRRRFGTHGFAFNYIPEVKADQIIGVSRDKNRADIWKSKLLIKKMFD